MAPSPEHDNEPKAPDKTDSKTTEAGEIRTSTDFLDDHLSSTTRDPDLQESSVSTLDDGQLKALLDEAINYKTPKDREGKSRIFKVLLQEAEEDERNARAASASGPQLARYYNTAARRHRNRRETTASSTLTHGGSLQDLAQSDLYSDAPGGGAGGHAGGRRSGGNRRRHHHPVTGHRTVSVSARQREGGSLPSNVNAGAGYDSGRLFDEEQRGKKRGPSFADKPQAMGKSVTTSATNIVADPKSPGEVATDTPSPQPPSEAQPANTPHPDYTIIELGPQPDEPPLASPKGDDLSASVEETRGLLSKDTKAPSYSSTEEALPRYRYQDNDDDKEGSLETGRRQLFDQQVTRHQYFNPLEEALNHRIPRIKYTSMAKLEVDGLVGPQTTVDKAISFPQFHQDRDANSGGAGSGLQLDADYTSVRSVVDDVGQSVAARHAPATIVPTQYRLLSVANPKIIHGVERFSHHDNKKGLDENGNAVSTTTSSAGSLLDAKKKKKCKVDRNVTVLKSEQVAGHRAAIIDNIDLLVKYIEEKDASTATKAKPHHVRNNMQKFQIKTSVQSQSIDNKRRARVKTKSEATATTSSVVKKSNSLEEISKTKLDDLTSEDPSRSIHKLRNRVKKQSTSEDGDRSWESVSDKSRTKKQSVSEDGEPRRSWEDEDSLRSRMKKQSTSEDETSAVINSETAEFHVVTKKKKSKKRLTSSANQYTPYHPPSAPRTKAPRESLPTRRKSACSVPPSEKSESSDVDSVHSLPAATHHRRDTATATSPASTSYADIARTNGGKESSSSASSNCSSHSNSGGAQLLMQQHAPAVPNSWKQLHHHQTHAQAQQPPQAEPDRDAFPTLDTQPPPRGAPPPAKPKERDTRTVVITNSARKGPLRRGGSRPAVIIFDGELAPPSSEGLTFGFELNEQLLNEHEFEEAGGAGAEPAEVFSARFMAPSAAELLTEAYNHDKIVTYVGLAWEDVVRQTNGKVQYYNGQ